MSPRFLKFCNSLTCHFNLASLKIWTFKIITMHVVPMKQLCNIFKKTVWTFLFIGLTCFQYNDVFYYSVFCCGKYSLKLFQKVSKITIYQLNIPCSIFDMGIFQNSFNFYSILLCRYYHKYFNDICKIICIYLKSIKN